MTTVSRKFCRSVVGTIQDLLRREKGKGHFLASDRCKPAHVSCTALHNRDRTSGCPQQPWIVSGSQATGLMKLYVDNASSEPQHSVVLKVRTPHRALQSA